MVKSKLTPKWTFELGHRVRGFILFYFVGVFMKSSS